MRDRSGIFSRNLEQIWAKPALQGTIAGTICLKVVNRKRIIHREF
jgi:hypothetical protein